MLFTAGRPTRLALDEKKRRVTQGSRTWMHSIRVQHHILVRPISYLLVRPIRPIPYQAPVYWYVLVLFMTFRPTLCQKKKHQHTDAFHWRAKQYWYSLPVHYGSKITRHSTLFEKLLCACFHVHPKLYTSERPDPHFSI